VSQRLTLILILGGALLAGAGLIYLKGRNAGIAQERPRTEAAADNAAARGAEADGERQSARALDGVIRRQRDDAAVLAQATQQARSAPDANQILSTDRAARLRAADVQLCLGAALRGCQTAAPADAIPGG
jgi:hypothetical protein